ncbi:MAG: ABC transporter ATP-binding protein [Rhodopirellula sp.]|nr:ABC transporter ATP-binding protein [Rhodopirellula sp.]
MSQSVWSLNGVTLRGRGRPRLDDVSLDIAAGVTAVMGSSGAGKSSLLGLLTDFEKPHVGSVRFYAPQAPDVSNRLPLFWSPQDHGLWPHLSVAEHIEYVRPSSPQMDRSVQQWLELFGLSGLLNSLPEQLSQGERSRLAIVRALASEASVLVLDEPLVHVDPWLAHRCWQMIAEHIERYCTTVTFSTHDPDAVLKYAQNVICLQDGAVGYAGSMESLFLNPPTRNLAWLLGPCNWFSCANGEEVDSRERLPLIEQVLFEENRAGPRVGDSPICVRPAQLELRPQPNSQFVVDSILLAATVVEVRLRDLSSSSCCDVFVARLSDEVRIGTAVQLVVHSSSIQSREKPVE